MKKNALLLTLSLVAAYAGSLRAGPMVETAAIAPVFEGAPTGGPASNPLLAGYGSMDAATRDNLLQRAAGVMSERGVSAETLSASQGASRELLMGMILGDVASQVSSEASSLYQTEGVGGQILGDAEKDPEKLRAKLAKIRGLYALFGDKKVSAFLDELDARAAKDVAERDAKKARIAAKRTAEALLQDFAPGFEQALMASQDPALNDVRGLLARLHSDRSPASFRSRLVSEIEDAAVRSENADVQALAVQGIMADAYLRPGGGLLAEGATPRALSAAERIAAASRSPRVEGLTIALLKRQAVRKPDYERPVSAAIDRLTDKGAKLAEINVPAARISGLFGAAPTPTLGLLAQFKIAVKESPFRAIALALYAAFWLPGAPIAALLAMLPAFFYITTKGLWRRQALAAALHFPAVYVAALAAGSAAMPAAYALGAVTIYAQLQAARWGFKNDSSAAPLLTIALGIAEAAGLLVLKLGLTGALAAAQSLPHGMGL